MITRLLSKNIADLQVNESLYHGSPEWRIEKILNEGLSLSESKPRYGSKPYLCFSPELWLTIYFTEHVHLLNDDRNKFIGIFRISKKNQREFNFRKDPFPMQELFRDKVTSLVTYEDVPPNCFDDLLLVDYTGKRFDLVGIAQRLEKEFKILVTSINYNLFKRQFEYKKY